MQNNTITIGGREFDLNFNVHRVLLICMCRACEHILKHGVPISALPYLYKTNRKCHKEMLSYVKPEV